MTLLVRGSASLRAPARAFIAATQMSTERPARLAAARAADGGAFSQTVEAALGLGNRDQAIALARLVVARI